MCICIYIYIFMVYDKLPCRHHETFQFLEHNNRCSIHPRPSCVIGSTKLSSDGLSMNSLDMLMHGVLLQQINLKILKETKKTHLASNIYNVCVYTWKYIRIYIRIYNTQNQYCTTRNYKPHMHHTKFIQYNILNNCLYGFLYLHWDSSGSGIHKLH